MATGSSIIKAGEIKETGISVETIDLSEHKFNARVLKNIEVSDIPVERELAGVPAKAASEKSVSEPSGQEADQPENETIEFDKIYDEQGNLSGLNIRCKCGELIELEFTQD